MGGANETPMDSNAPGMRRYQLTRADAPAEESIEETESSILEETVVGEEISNLRKRQNLGFVCG